MWRRGEGRVKRKTYYLSRDAEPRRRLQPFPPETEEAGEEEAENAEEEVARSARLARGAGRTAAGAAPGRGAGSAAVVVRKRGAAGQLAASLGPGSQTAASAKPPPPRVPRDRGVESRGDASRLPGRSGHPTPVCPSLQRHKWSVMIQSEVPGREGLQGHLMHCCFVLAIAHKFGFSIFLFHSSVPPPPFFLRIMGLTNGLAAVKMDFLRVTMGSHCSTRNVKRAGCSANPRSLSWALDLHGVGLRPP